MPNLQERLAELKATRAAIQKDYENFVTKLKQELKVAEMHRFTQESIDRLKAQLKDAKKNYQPYIDDLDLEIDLVEKVIAAEEKEANDLAEQRAAQEESEMRKSLYAAWIESGGRPSEFESVWPELKKAELVKRTQAAMAQRPGDSAFQVGSGF